MMLSCPWLPPRFFQSAILLIAACAIPLCALDLKSLKPQGYVSDFAGVVDDESKKTIDDYAGNVEKATGAQMSFVTLKTLEGEPLEDVSIDLFKQFGVGQKGKDNGIQLLLVIDDHRSRLEVGNGLEPILPDGLDGQILLDMRPELQAGHYGHAMLLAAQRIGGTIAQARGVQVAAPPPIQPESPPVSSSPQIPWGLIVFGIVALIVFFSRGSRGGRGGGGGGFLPGLILGNLLGGGFSGGNGGGFGGSNGGGGSSGGFGGFGGGDADGGGASSGW